jgi:hypothetical protein
MTRQELPCRADHHTAVPRRNARSLRQFVYQRGEQPGLLETATGKLTAPARKGTALAGVDSLGDSYVKLPHALPRRCSLLRRGRQPQHPDGPVGPPRVLGVAEVEVSGECK